MKIHRKMASAKWRLFGHGLNELTYRGRDKMDSISQTTFSNAFSWMKISIDISLNFVPYGPTDYKSALVQIMAWRRAGDKPLYEPMMT